MAIHDLGSEGLGNVRSRYCSEAMGAVAEDARRALEEIHGSAVVS
jgi:hypothetical protein